MPFDIDSAQSHALFSGAFWSQAPFFSTAFHKAESIESICSSATQYFWRWEVVSAFLYGTVSKQLWFIISLSKWNHFTTVIVYLVNLVNYGSIDLEIEFLAKHISDSYKHPSSAFPSGVVRGLHAGVTWFSLVWSLSKSNITKVYNHFLR